MKRLEVNHFESSVSLLQEFIRTASEDANKTRIAGLALHQLQTIYAGADPESTDIQDPTCNGKPRAG